MQVALLVALSFLIAYSFLRTDWIGIPSVSFALMMLVTTNIIRISEKSYRDFAQFLNNVSHNDFSTSTTAFEDSSSARAFVDAQKMMLAKYRKLKVDRTIQNEYLQMVVEHVDTALLCFDDNGNIEFINHATRELLKKKYISNISVIGSLSKNLEEALRTIHSGEHIVLKIVLSSELQSLILTASEFVLLEKKYKLVSMQNIKSALDEREIESWQKLIKVLTHEIMNSMTPIVSLSHYVKKVVGDAVLTGQVINEESEQYTDLRQSIDAISSRSQGLMEFVNSYRSLSNLPQPVFSDFEIQSLFQRIESLLKETLEAKDIRFVTEITPNNLTLTADSNLLEQVLLNLVSNAIDAVEGVDSPHIELRCLLATNGRVLIQIKDNGCGISKEVMDNIFTPFFTTKEKGSGIGLSLSRQLTRLNKGTLSASSVEGIGSQFTLTF
tara:strand:+ start:1134 stop:2453 length:1320 start_codon:yes stop_codon:yes gene_type:complete